MEIKEKLCSKIYKDNKTLYLYGPDLSIEEIDSASKVGEDCWLLSKPVQEATKDDVIECLDSIYVWFSDFKTYKSLLERVYGPEVFPKISKKRWEFLNLNKNRFKLMYTAVGDYGCAFDQFFLVCFDTKESTYISLNIYGDKTPSCFEIRQLKTSEESKEKIVRTIEKSDLIERNEYASSSKGFSYKLDHQEYEPLFKFYKFVRSFYFYYYVDGILTSWFEPLDVDREINISD